MKSPQKACMCNSCEFGPDKKVPSQVTVDFETTCSIAEKCPDGHFRAAMVFPWFKKECPRLKAYQESR